jgi:hypothetical protein
MTLLEKEINIARKLRNGLYQYSVNLPNGPTLRRIYGTKTEDGLYYVIMQESITGLQTPLSTVPIHTEIPVTPEYIVNSKLLEYATKSAIQLGESRNLPVNFNPIKIV